MSPQPKSSGAPPPDPLYKYARYEHAEAMIERGSFAIGTPYGFRDEETHGSEVGDAGEGTKRITQYVESATLDEIRDSPIVAANISAPPGTDIQFTGATFRQILNVEDVYVFCVSREPRKQALRDFGKDVCLRISTPILFFRALTLCLFSQEKIIPGSKWILRPCVYAERDTQYGSENPVYPAFLKPPRYAYQKEYRTIWQARSQPIQPVIINCPEASQFLSIQPL